MMPHLAPAQVPIFRSSTSREIAQIESHLRHDAVPGQQRECLVGAAAGCSAPRGRQNVRAAQVAGHDDDGVAEADGAAL